MAQKPYSTEYDISEMPKWFPAAMYGIMFGSALLVGAFVSAVSPDIETVVGNNTTETTQLANHVPALNAQP